jgi:four helix bundle protein
MGSNAALNKSKAFAIKIIHLSRYLGEDKKEFILSKQLLRSGTSIGANVKEAQRAQSKKDFITKMNIASKEASETEYWLELLYETGYISKTEYQGIYSDCSELIKLLVSIVKTSQTNLALSTKH